MVFRFTSFEDKAWFDNAITRILKQQLGDEFADLQMEEPYFVDFLRDAPEPTGDEPEDADLDMPKVYELIPSYEFLSERLTMFMHQYNETVRGGQMDMVFFKDAMVHLIKVWLIS